MAKSSKSSKRLFAMAYGLGASIGLVTEAIIFAISAFEPIEDDLDWSLVYPELGEGTARERMTRGTAEVATENQGMLSQKLDQMLKDAKIDSELMSSLGNSIRSFEGAAKGIAPTAEAMSSTRKYSEEMALAAAQMDSLNSLYKVQIESASRQADANEQVAQNAEQLKQQMQNLATNLSSLNGVYGGMLSAMTVKN